MIVMLLLIILAFAFLYRQWRMKDLIRLGTELGCGLRALPFIGHSYMFLGDENRMKGFQMLGTEALRNGGTTAFWLGSYLYAMIADPVIAEVVLKTCLEKDDIMKMATILIGNGSIFAPVPIWRRRRKVLLQNFGMKSLKHFLSIFTEQSAVLVQQMRNTAGAGTISVWKYFTTYTMDVIAEATIGYKMNAQMSPNNPFLEAFNEGLSMTAGRLCQPWLHSDLLYKNLPVYWEQIRQRDFLWSIVNESIRSKRKELKEAEHSNSNSNLDLRQDGLKTFLELLMQSGDAGYTDKEVIEESMVIMMAGNDTTAVAASFVCVILSRHPDVQEKVYQELQEVFRDSSRQITREDLPHLKYMDAVIRETLRLYPPVPVITRKVDRNVVLPSGITLLPGSGVVVNIWAMHRNPLYWGEDADIFRPERFLDTDKHPAFMAFSHGPRNCLGYQFAMMSIKTALSSLLRHFKILPTSQPASLKSGYPPMRLKFDLMMKDVDNFQVQIVSRS